MVSKTAKELADGLDKAIADRPWGEHWESFSLTRPEIEMVVRGLRALDEQKYSFGEMTGDDFRKYSEAENKIMFASREVERMGADTRLTNAVISLNQARQHVANFINGKIEPKPHSDDIHVDRFAQAMKDKLAEARAKGREGWGDSDRCSQDSLSGMLVQHVMKGDPVDVANFCMFLHQRGETISTGVIGEHLANVGELEAKISELESDKTGQQQVIDANKGYIETLESILGDADALASNMVEGKIVKPKIEHIGHIYPGMLLIKLEERDDLSRRAIEGDEAKAQLERRKDDIPAVLSNGRMRATIIADLAWLDGNEIWEALMSICQGDVPEELSEEVLNELAGWLKSAANFNARATPGPMKSQDARELLQEAMGKVAQVRDLLERKAPWDESKGE